MMRIKAAIDAVRWPGVLSIRNFRIYFFGSLVSNVGTWMQTTAQAWYVLQLTDSSIALATVTALQFLPITLFSLFGGALADRLPRRRALLFTQIALSVQAFILGVLAVTNVAQLWHINVLAFVLGTINAINMPLRQSFLPELVGRSNLSRAVALNSLIMKFGRVAGPALAGIVITTVGTPVAFLINGIAFAGTITGLTLIREKELQLRVRDPKPGNLFAQIGQGVSFAWRTPGVLSIFIVVAFVGTFGFNFTIVIPLVATYLVHASPAEFGILNSCLGAGAMMAALILSRRGSPTPGRILAAATVFGTGLVSISQSDSLLITGFLFLVVGTSTVTFSTAVNTSLQLQAPDHMGGRMVSMFQLFNTGTSPFSAELTGGMAHLFGVGPAVALNGAMCLVGVVVALVYRARKLGLASLGLSVVASQPGEAVLATAPSHGVSRSEPA